MSRLIVVLDGRGDPDGVALRDSLGRALTPEASDLLERAPSPPGSGALDEEFARIHHADAAIVLDADSLERARQAGVKLCVALLPGFEVSWGGNLREADAVLCAHSHLRESLVRRGVRPNRVSVVGPVVPDHFAPANDRAELRDRWGLDADIRVVVVPSELFDLAGPEVLIVQLSLIEKPAVFLFDVGEDGDAADLLRRRAPVHDLEAFIFAKEANTQELWALADLALGRPRGPEVSRALAHGLPLVLVPGGRPAVAAVGALEASGVGSMADAVATLAVELDRCLEEDALSTAQQAVADLDVAGGLARVAAKLNDLLSEQPTDALPGRGLPHGLERVSSRGEEEERASPSDAAMDRKVEEELEALKSRLSGES